jgi:hypothetical protein
MAEPEGLSIVILFASIMQDMVCALDLVEVAPTKKR